MMNGKMSRGENELNIMMIEAAVVIIKKNQMSRSHEVSTRRLGGYASCRSQNFSLEEKFFVSTSPSLLISIRE